MFERIDYSVIRIDGDYAYLMRLGLDTAGTAVPGAEEKCVARALLPPEITEGSFLKYEMLQYTLMENSPTT